MIDRCGRNIDYLRISVTDRCNLRCIYCMPEDGVKRVDRSLILQEPEILRICRVMAQLGIKKIKITGGEPLVRPGIPGLIRQIKAISGIEKVTLTTNGILLKEQMSALSKAGLDGLNVSLDTLDRGLYQRLTRRDELENAMEGFREALKYPEISLKLNCVPLGREEQDLCEIAALAKNYPVHVRFIEMMPIGQGREFRGMSENQVLKVIEGRFGPLRAYTGIPLGNGPCHYYEAEGFSGKIGFISAISHKFCSQCNRMRLTSQGFLKTCLQYTAGRDLRRILRSGCTDEELKDVIRAALAEKPDGHVFRRSGDSSLQEEGAYFYRAESTVDETEKQCMSQIGG